MRLSDTIEQFIKTMLNEDMHDIELKRNELASYFGCAPSQINYVLSTRFTPDHGYVIESRRGGGGCIRIIRIEGGSAEQLLFIVRQRIGETISECEATRLLSQLVERRIISANEAKLMGYAITSQALSVPMPETLKDALRASILKSMLLAIMQTNATPQSDDIVKEM